MPRSPQPVQIEQDLRVSHVALGAASPLWGLYAGAAMTGMAFWWLNAWTRPQNLEALFEAAETLPEAPVVTTPLALVEIAAILEPVVAAEAAAEAAVEAISPEPVVEAVAGGVETVEAVIEPVIKPVIKPVIEPVVDPILEAVAEPEPVLEAAPVEPVAPQAELEAPKPAARPRAPKTAESP